MGILRNTLKKALVAFLLSSAAHAVDVSEREAARKRGTECGTRIRESFAEPESNERDEAFKLCLGAYIRTRTANPPGDEEIGADFLEYVFRELGIPTLRIATRAERGMSSRTSLIATLTPANSANGPLKSEGFAWGRSSFRSAADPIPRSIVLLNHIDVVGVTPEEWALPELPWSGEVYSYRGRDDLWGRGALDMKGLAMLQLFSMAELKAKAVRIRKAVHFVAVADEERDASGATQVVSEIRRGGDLEALLGTEVALGEGGFSLRDSLGSGSLIELIGTEEKGGAWLELRHREPSAMLADLIRLGIVPYARHNYTWWASRWGCSLGSVHVDDSQINASPSSVHAQLSCRSQPNLAEIKKAFETSDAASLSRLKISSATIVRSEGAEDFEFRVHIQTESKHHGASHSELSALDVLAIGLQRLSVIEISRIYEPNFFRHHQTEATRMFIRATGENHRLRFLPRIPNLPWWVSWFSSLKRMTLRHVGGALASEALFRSGCRWNGFEAGVEGATALLDCRLTHPEAMGLTAGRREGTQFAELLSKYLDDSGLSIRVLTEWNFTESPIQHPAVRAMFGEMRLQWSKASPTPWMFPAGSDLRLFREPHVVGSELSPVPSYGFFPCPIPISYLQTIHGSNERYPVREIRPSLDVYARVVKRLVH